MTLASRCRWTATLCTALLASASALAGSYDAYAPQIQAQLHLGPGFTVQDLDLPAGVGEAEVRVDLGGFETVLAMAPHSMRSDHFKLLVDAGNGPTEVAAPTPATYRGDVFQLRGTSTVTGLVRASMHDGSLWARVRFDDGRVYGVQPLSEIVAGAPAKAHVVYDEATILPGDWTCVAKSKGGDVGIGIKPAKENYNLAVNYKIAEIAADADFEFYSQNGSSVTNTTFDIENVLNGVEGIYEGEVSITYELTTVVIRTTSASSPYTTTDSDQLLNQFDSYWSANMGAVQRDVAHLFTGKNMNGSVIGIAWIQGICNNSAYSVVQSKFSGSYNSRISLSSHELGHNWSAQHCDGAADCGIMCSFIGGCAGDLTHFGVGETNQINNYKNGKTCLGTQGDSLALPFNETFPSTTFDSTKWTMVDGATIGTGATAEPSSPNALDLDAAGAGDYLDDEVRTNFLLAAGVSNVQLSYKVERIGVEAGEQLVIEYRTNAMTWAEINRLTSDGVNQTSFTTYTHILPANAKHNELRIRFRTEVNETNDDWYIDDISVTIPATPAPAISSLLPTTLQTISSGFFTINGSSFTGATQVKIGTSTYASGAFTLVDDGQIKIASPFPAALGAQPVTVTTPSGTSNAVNVTFIPNEPPILFAPVITSNGSNFGLEWSGIPNATTLLSVNVTNSTFLVNGYTALSPLALISLPNTDAVGHGAILIPLSGAPAGVFIYTNVWMLPPGATNTKGMKTTEVKSSQVLF